MKIHTKGGGAGVSSIKKTGESEITGDVTVTQGDNITITQSGQDLKFDGALGGSGEPHQAEIFLVFLQDSTWKARNGDTGAIPYSDANPRIVINQALSAGGGGPDQRKVVIRGNV